MRGIRNGTCRRLTSVALALLVLVGTFGMAPLLKTNFFDQGEQEVMSVKQELAPGTSLEAADASARKAEKVLDGIDEIKDYQVTVGSSGFMAAFGGGTGANQASYQLTLKDAGSYEKTRDRIDEELGKLKGTQPWPLGAWPDVPTRCIQGREDRFFPLDFQRRIARERLGITVEEMPGGHLLALSRPAELADLICR